MGFCELTNIFETANIFIYHKSFLSSVIPYHYIRELACVNQQIPLIPTFVKRADPSKTHVHFLLVFGNLNGYDRY